MNTSTSCASSLVDITGLCNPENTTEVLSSLPYWRQMHISETLQIPAQKPDIEQINAVDVAVSILRAQVIRSPRSYDDSVSPPHAQANLEGKLLSGRKLIIEGQLCQKIVYTALVPEQSVHSAHFYVPFSAFIVVPREFTFTDDQGRSVTIDSLDLTFDVNYCIEDVSACVLDSRKILKQVTFMLNAVPTRTPC